MTTVSHLRLEAQHQQSDGITSQYEMTWKVGNTELVRWWHDFPSWRATQRMVEQAGADKLKELWGV